MAQTTVEHSELVEYAKTLKQEVFGLAASLFEAGEHEDFSIKMSPLKYWVGERAAKRIELDDLVVDVTLRTGDITGLVRSRPKSELQLQGSDLTKAEEEREFSLTLYSEKGEIPHFATLESLERARDILKRVNP
jgi:hypothetical protein